MRPDEHAAKASRLLDGAEALSSRLENATPDERLQMAATGGFAQVNADLRWTAELAIAHALTAIALVSARPRPG